MGLEENSGPSCAPSSEKKFGISGNNGSCAPKTEAKKSAASDCCSGGSCGPASVPKSAGGGRGGGGGGGGGGGCCEGDVCAPKAKCGPSPAPSVHSQPSAKGGCCSGGSCSRPSPTPSVGDLLKSTNPEEAKDFGNALYKQGKFDDALRLYERAIGLDPTKAAYQANKAAALAGLNRLREAISACEEALRLDANYSRARQRLVKLFIRVGDFENARNVSSLLDASEAGQFTDSISKVEKEIENMDEFAAKSDWTSVLKLTESVQSLGADSHPKALISKTKALLSLHRLNEADASLQYAKKLISPDDLEFDSPLSLLSLDIDVALGRFESAVTAAEVSLKKDLDNNLISSALKKARALLNSRNSGNQFFKQQEYDKAIEFYSQGLELDEKNAVLLCNRAACYSKQGKWDDALRDCEFSLQSYPSFTKALLRKANCLSQLGRWQEAVDDYKALRKIVGEDYEITKMFTEAQISLRKNLHEKVSKNDKVTQSHDHIIELTNSKLFQPILSQTDYVLIDFYANWCGPCKQIAPIFFNLSERFLNVQFVKVNVDVVRDLAASENVSSIPTFKLFKNGKLVKEMKGANASELESTLKSLPSH